MHNTLQGKVAVVTGGNSGIGLASARLFATHGAQVVVTARRQDMLDAAVRDIGHGAIGIRGDVAELAHHAALARELGLRFGRVDVYMANAGMIRINASREVTPEEFDAQFATNTRGVFFGVQSVLPLMRRGGSIILTSSLAATKVLAGHAVYAGTKAAIAAFARSWTLELRSAGVRVNVLSPGPVETAILDKLGVPDAERPAFLQSMAEAIPTGRMGTAEELARAALFLASDASSFVNGIELRADGGMALT
jgi:NAD(P)-dependent dehydrogenase (short-subunit alcohol dehydrogenase family)